MDLKRKTKIAKNTINRNDKVTDNNLIDICDSINISDPINIFDPIKSIIQPQKNVDNGNTLLSLNYNNNSMIMSENLVSRTSSDLDLENNVIDENRVEILDKNNILNVKKKNVLNLKKKNKLRDNTTSRNSSILLNIIVNEDKYEIEQFILAIAIESKESVLHGIVSLINLMLEVAGFPPESIEEGQIVGTAPQDVIEEVLVTLEEQEYHISEKYILRSSIEGSNSFNSLYYTFWFTIGSQFEIQELISTFSKNMLVWLYSLSSHGLRNLRHSGTVSGIAFCDGLLTQLEKLEEDISRFNSQLEKECKINSKLSSVISSIEKRISSTQEQYDLLKSIIDDISLSIPNIRWRDKYPIVREETFRGIFLWMKKNPNLFLKDSRRNRFLGWALFDREDSVRILATKCLLEIILDSNLWSILQNTPFLDTFVSRIIELPNDRSHDVCINGLKILQQLSDKNSLTDEQIETAIECIWSCPSLLTLESNNIPIIQRRHNLSILHAFSDFIDSAIFTNSILYLGSLKSSDYFESIEISKVALDLRSILEFLVEFGTPYLAYTDVFVSSFWMRAPCFFRFDFLIDFLTIGESSSYDLCFPPLSEKYKLPLYLLTLSILRHLILTCNLSDTPREIKFKDMMNCNIECTLSSAVQMILKRGSTLLRLTKSNTETLSLCAYIINSCVTHKYLVSSEINLSHTFQVACDIFISCSEIPPIDFLVSIIFGLRENDIKYIESLYKSLIDSIKEYFEKMDLLPSETKANSNDIMLNSETIHLYTDEFELSLRKLLGFAKYADINIFEYDVVILELIDLLCMEFEKPKEKRKFQQSLLMRITTLNILTLSFLHYWSDLEEIIKNFNDNLCKRTTEESMLSPFMDSIESARKKRRLVNDTTSDPSLSSVPNSTNNDQYMSPQNASLDISKLKLLKKYYSILSSIVKTIKCRVPLFYGDHKQNEFVDLSGFCMILEICQFSFFQFDSIFLLSNVTINIDQRILLEECYHFHTNLMRDIHIESFDIVAIEKCYVTYLESLDQLFCEYTPSCVGIYDPCTISVFSAMNSRIPIINSLLQHNIIDSTESTPKNYTDPMYQEYIVWRALYLTKLFTMIPFRQVARRNIGVWILSLLWYKRSDFDKLSIDFFKRVIDESLNQNEKEKIMIWILLHNLFKVFVDTKNFRSRLKTIITRFIKYIPNRLISEQMEELITFFKKVTELWISAESFELKRSNESSQLLSCLSPFITKMKGTNVYISLIERLKDSFMDNVTLFSGLQQLSVDARA